MTAIRTGKLIVIAGPTASGKTGLALQLANVEQHELLNVDSLQLFTELTIGNNKGELVPLTTHMQLPNIRLQAQAYPERTDIPIWLTDLLSAQQQFSVQQFQQLAREVIADIHSRGKTPILVGGSGLYLLATISDYKFVTSSETSRDNWQGMTVGDLQAKLAGSGFDLQSLNNSDRQNPRRLRNLLQKNSLAISNVTPAKLLYECEFHILAPKIEQLAVKLELRVQTMLSAGLIAEVESLLATYGSEQLSPTIKTASGYRQVLKLLQYNPQLVGEYATNLSAEIFTSHRQLAKKQLTWNKKYLLPLAD